MAGMDAYVSIHAPREGCDPSRARILTTRLRFQFTHPGRGATDELHGEFRTGKVSIHAPREGCDRSAPYKSCYLYGFNSRTPGGVRLARNLI